MISRFSQQDVEKITLKVFALSLVSLFPISPLSPLSYLKPSIPKLTKN